MRSRRPSGWILVALLVLCSLAVFSGSVVRVFRVHGTSMDPTLRPGDYVIADRTVSGVGLPLVGRTVLRNAALRRGDIIVFTTDPARRRFLVKRIIALPGDTLAMSGGRIRLNGKEIPEPYLPRLRERPENVRGPDDWHYSHLLTTVRRSRYRPTGTDWGPILVPEDAYFVLGDNRRQSGDSRSLGFVRRGEMIARVFRVM